MGGVSLEDAELVHRELGTAEPFDKVWALADWDASERLSEPQFLLFMFLLKALRKGRPLPPRLGLRQVSAFVANMSCGSKSMELQIGRFMTDKSA